MSLWIYIKLFICSCFSQALSHVFQFVANVTELWEFKQLIDDWRVAVGSVVV